MVTDKLLAVAVTVLLSAMHMSVWQSLRRDSLKSSCARVAERNCPQPRGRPNGGAGKQDSNTRLHMLTCVTASCSYTRIILIASSSASSGVAWAVWPSCTHTQTHTGITTKRYHVLGAWERVGLLCALQRKALHPCGCYTAHHNT